MADDKMLPLDIEAERASVRAALEASGEMDALTGTLDVYDANSLMTFGAQASRGVARAADAALSDLRTRGRESVSAPLDALADVLTRFAEAEGPQRQGLAGRLFKRGGPEKGDLLRRYDALAAELDRAMVRLRACQEELRRTDRQLEAVSGENLDQLRALEKYIAAGETGCGEIRDYLEKREAMWRRTGDAQTGMEVQTLRHALEQLERRVQDLRTGEAVAVQTAAMLATARANNRVLLERLDDAFARTLPAFRQAIEIEARAKRRALADAGLRALEQRAGRALTGSPSVDVDKARRALIEAVARARSISQDADAQLARDRARLEAIREQGTGNRNSGCRAGQLGG